MPTMLSNVETKTGAIIEIALSAEEITQCCQKKYADQVAYLASQAKRQKVEVRTHELNPDEKKQFLGAKHKEVDQWLATETVRRTARHKIPEENLLKTRWVSSWKQLDPQEQKETGRTRKPKARLVILGFMDPSIETLDRDAPTLGRDSRFLIMQVLASARWGVQSFDIKTAFLRGSRRDNGVLGIEPPEEMRERMHLQPHQACELFKSAYNLVSAPLLWYTELTTALLSFGISPLDPCVFALPKTEYQNGKTDALAIHGILGVQCSRGRRDWRWRPNL